MTDDTQTLDGLAQLLIGKIIQAPDQSPIRKVVIDDGKVTVSFATKSTLELWESAHGGYFTSFPIAFEKWERKEKNRFLPLQRARRIMFFVVLGQQYLRIYPTREFSR